MAVSSQDSHTPATHGADAHGEHAADHVVVDHSHHTHVASFGTFLNVYIALLFLTFVTVAVAEPVSGLALGGASMIVAMAVAALKASLVMTIFMHLKGDTAINNIAFLSSLLFLSLLFLFTLADHATRGVSDPIAGTPVDVPAFGSD